MFCMAIYLRLKSLEIRQKNMFLAAAEMIAIVHIDFHPHWHINRPSPSFEYIPPPIILDLISRQLRRTQETERRAHVQANNRLRII
jgi:hypothetical protein